MNQCDPAAKRAIDERPNIPLLRGGEFHYAR